MNKRCIIVVQAAAQPAELPGGKERVCGWFDACVAHRWWKKSERRRYWS